MGGAAHILLVEWKTAAPNNDSTRKKLKRTHNTKHIARMHWHQYQRKHGLIQARAHTRSPICGYSWHAHRRNERMYGSASTKAIELLGELCDTNQVSDEATTCAFIWPKRNLCASQFFVCYFFSTRISWLSWCERVICAFTFHILIGKIFGFITKQLN